MTGFSHKIVGGNPNTSTAGSKARNEQKPSDLAVSFLHGDDSIPGIITYLFDGRPVRVALIDGEPRLVAEDLFNALGSIWNGNSSVWHVPRDFRRIHPIRTPSGAENVPVLSIPGLLALLDTSSSPNAISVLRWVICEVLPSLHWSGQQNSKPERSYPTVMSLSPEPINRLAANAKALAMEIKRLNARTNQVDSRLTQLMSSQRLYNPPIEIRKNMDLDEVADVMGIEFEGLLEALRQMKVLRRGCEGYWFKRNMPYITFLCGSKPYFKFRLTSNSNSQGGTEFDSILPIATPLGIKWLFSLLWAGRFNSSLKTALPNPGHPSVIALNTALSDL